MTDSVSDRLESAVAAIDGQNERLSIVTAMDVSAARKAAAEADKRAAAGERRGPLDGLLLGVKDNVAVAGLPWTGGLGARKGLLADRDAKVVTKLRGAGAIPFAMLNMHEGALGATTDNPHFGRCLNPLDEERTPGGSSGGSGAALAAGFCDGTLGTDTMGSVRIPAAYCGVAGLKPTRGTVAQSGLLYLAPSLDTIGPLARDLATLAAMFEAMGGGKETELDAPASVTLGVPRQIAEVDCEPAVLSGFEHALKAAEAVGLKLREINMEGWSPGHARRGGLLVSEAEGAVEMADMLERPGDNLMSADLRSLLTYGKNLSEARLAEGYDRVKTAARAADAAFDEVDLILTPTAPQLPFRWDEPVPANQADFTSLANFHGGPALALPIPGHTLPGSVQIMGPLNAEPLVLAVGRALEKSL